MSRNKVPLRPWSRMFPVWWNARCNNLFLQKKFLFKQARRLLSTDHWIKYKRISAKLRCCIKEAKRTFWDSACKDSRDPNLVFRIFRKLKNRNCSQTEAQLCLLRNGEHIFNPRNQAEYFADQFGLHADHHPLPLTYGLEEDGKLNRIFSITELTEAISRTKVTSPGEDQVSARLFKNLNDHSLNLLLHIYNEIWSSGNVPASWKSAIILPILKPGKSSLTTSSYRPIALTSVTCKIFERMVAKRLNLYLIQNHLTDPNHLGFLPFRDSRAAITKLHIDLHQAKKQKKFILGASLDLKAAYDSIFIDGLVLKCACLGITGRILHWIHNFLVGRRIKVSWRQVRSSYRHLDRGVPQGAVLSPVLFTIFLSDLFEALSPNVRCVVYADDIFVYCISDSISSGRSLLQDTLRQIFRWSSFWKLDISAEKCQAINLSRRKGDCDFELYIGGKPIPWSSKIKFLGFMFARRGGFRHQVDLLRKKAFSRINILKALASTRYGARSHHLLLLANSTVRSLVDYVSPVLCSASVSLLRRLEVVHTSALRIATGLPKWTPNDVIRIHAASPPLQSRMRELSRCFWLKHLSLGRFSPFADVLGSEPQRFPDPAASLPADLVEALNVLDCQKDCVIQFQFPLCSPDDSIRLLLGGLPFQRTDLNERAISSYFSDFLNSLDIPYDLIGTDASKTPRYTSIAGCSWNSQFCYLVNQVNSIFTAEALAIGMAIDELISPVRPCIIFSDSLSVLSALQNVSITSPTVILWLQSKLRRAASLSSCVTLCWVPGHRGIPLNEKADFLAKNVGEHDVPLDWISVEDARAFLWNRAYEENIKFFRSSPYFSQLGTPPSIRTTSSWARSRREDVLISRFLTKQLITPAILHRFHLTNNPLCHQCQAPDNIEHIICFCSKYTQIRLLCFKHWVSSLQVASFCEVIAAVCKYSNFRSAMLEFIKNIDRF